MADRDLSLFAPLREAYDASRGVRTRADLICVLEDVATLISERLGWRSVGINLHRRAWDDFETVVVHGCEESRSLLQGTTQSW